MQSSETLLKSFFKKEDKSYTYVFAKTNSMLYTFDEKKTIDFVVVGVVSNVPTYIFFYFGSMLMSKMWHFKHENVQNFSWQLKPLFAGDSISQVLIGSNDYVYQGLAHQHISNTNTFISVWNKSNKLIAAYPLSNRQPYMHIDRSRFYSGTIEYNNNSAPMIMCIQKLPLSSFLKSANLMNTNTGETNNFANILILSKKNDTNMSFFAKVFSSSNYDYTFTYPDNKQLYCYLQDYDLHGLCKFHRIPNIDQNLSVIYGIDDFLFAGSNKGKIKIHLVKT
jgi:hypothetical protein